MRFAAVSTAVFLLFLSHQAPAPSAEVIRLDKENFAQYAPKGKEADAIFGDLVLKNDRITVVIARPIPTRHANLTVKNVGGSIIDLTFNQGSNDQLSAFYPMAARYRYSEDSLAVTVDGKPCKDLPAKGAQVSISLTAPAGNGRPQTQVIYTLKDSDAFVHVDSVFLNTLKKPMTVVTSDSIRADKTFVMDVDPKANLFWVYDEWFRQAYGVVITELQPEKGARGIIELHHADGSPEMKLAPGESKRVERKVFPGRNLFNIRAAALRLAKSPVKNAMIEVKDPSGPVFNAKITALVGDKPYAWGRTWKKGRLYAPLPPGKYTLRVEALGRPTVTRQCEIGGEKPQAIAVEMQACGYAKLTVTDDKSRPIPAKIAFYGIDGTKTPFFGPDSRPARVHNLIYTARGRATTEIGPGTYEVVVSYGPEYNAAFERMTIKQGETTELVVSLPRVVDSRGWISADFHSHSSPSGDNTTSQRGRVLNLLCEHIEFAPCTEHNRISSYVPHLKALKVRHLMATCPGMELTGQLLPVNHQNAFPLVHKPHRQDGGGPRVDDDPVVQIRRLAMWDDNAEKLVQANHPDLQRIYGDRDLDGKPDTGFREMLDVMHVVEVHPP